MAGTQLFFNQPVSGAFTGAFLADAGLNPGFIGTASWADTASFAVTTSGTSSFAVSASHAEDADNAISASYALTASFASKAATADAATSASHAVQADNAATADFATSASFADQALHADAADTAVSASHAVQADNAATADFATSASFADQALHANDADTADFATSASFADQALHANTADAATSASYALTSSFASKAATASFASKAAVAPANITFNTLYGAEALLQVPEAVTEHDVGQRTAFDLTGYTQARIIARVTQETANSGTLPAGYLLPVFSTGGDLGPFFFLGGGDPDLPVLSASLDNVGTIVSPWAAITASAQADVLLTWETISGSDAGDADRPGVASINLQVR